MSQVIDMEELKRVYALPSWGHTDIELGVRFEVDRTAIYKARRKLRDEEGITFERTDRGRYRIDRKKLVSNIPAKAPEAVALYVATRRLSRHNRLARKHVQNALEKLSEALYHPMAERLVQAAAKLPELPNAQKRQTIYETLVQAWTEDSKVRIWYRGLKNDTALVHGVSPYLIEPSPWSDSVYLIGYSDVMEKIVPFKIDRIEKAVLTSEEPKRGKMDQETLFKFAWGIWDSDKEPELVQLKFTGREAIRRLDETIWHPKEEKIPQDDGSVIWQAEIADWQEMLPWVRGWGADCIVLTPKGLRAEIEREIRKLTRIYNLETATISRSDDDYHQKRANQLFRE